jgi:hypothetical protein
LLYVVSVIYKLANILNIDSTVREKIWKFVKLLILTELSLFKDNYLDCVILLAFYLVINNGQREKTPLENYLNK